MQYQKYSVQRASPFGVPGLLGFHNTVLVDGFSLVFSCIFLAATGLVVLLSVRYLNVEEEQEGRILCSAPAGLHWHDVHGLRHGSHRPLPRPWRPWHLAFTFFADISAAKSAPMKPH